MPILLAALVFACVMAVVAIAGMKLWVKPKEAIDRVTGVGMGVSEPAPAHPSLAFHELLQKIGNALPASPKDANVVQKRLIRAGFRNPGAMKVLYGSKVVLAIVLPLLMTAVVTGSAAPTENKFLAVMAAVAAGFFGPNEYVKWASRRRQKRLRRGLPNALDLLVVCVESGLGLDQAIVQVAKELEHAHPEISEEFAIVNLELKAGNRRADALRNLAERTGVEDLRKLVAVLIQADRFGTGIAASLRAHADYMRVQARQVAEEKAAKLGVKLIFPIFFCILPSLFVVTVGPMVVRIIRELIPMMNNM
jgi:tight adherence protein C